MVGSTPGCVDEPRGGTMRTHAETLGAEACRIVRKITVTRARDARWKLGIDADSCPCREEYNSPRQRNESDSISLKLQANQLAVMARA